MLADGRVQFGRSQSTGRVASISLTCAVHRLDFYNLFVSSSFYFFQGTCGFVICKACSTASGKARMCVACFNAVAASAMGGVGGGGGPTSLGNGAGADMPMTVRLQSFEMIFHSLLLPPTPFSCVTFFSFSLDPPRALLLLAATLLLSTWSRSRTTLSHLLSLVFVY